MLNQQQINTIIIYMQTIILPVNQLDKRGQGLHIENPQQINRFITSQQVRYSSLTPISPSTFLLVQPTTLCIPQISTTFRSYTPRGKRSYRRREVSVEIDILGRVLSG